MSGYCHALELDREAVRNNLYAYERRYLDGLMAENETMKSVKAQTAKALSALQEQLKLSRADFTVYMVGALGLREYVAYPGTRGFVVLMDIIALKKHDRLMQMPELTVECIHQIRKILDSSEGGAVWVSRESAS